MGTEQFPSVHNKVAPDVAKDQTGSRFPTGGDKADAAPKEAPKAKVSDGNAEDAAKQRRLDNLKKGRETAKANREAQAKRDEAAAKTADRDKVRTSDGPTGISDVANDNLYGTGVPDEGRDEGADPVNGEPEQGEATDEPALPSAGWDRQVRAAERWVSAPTQPAEFFRGETAPVRVKSGQPAYSVWNCPDSPDERIVAGPYRVLAFHHGVLRCPTPEDDANVVNANRYAGGKYLRADPDMIDNPQKCTACDRIPTYWHSRAAFERHLVRKHRSH